MIYSILARDGSVQTYTIIVEVLTNDDISKLQITGLPEKMIIGETHTPVVETLFPDDSSIEVTEVAWEVSNPKIIGIKDGQLQAMRAGTVNVSAQLGGIHSEEYSNQRRNEKDRSAFSARGRRGLHDPITRYKRFGNGDRRQRGG